jgi:hypothetical protein
MTAADRDAVAALIAANPDLDPTDLADAYTTMADTDPAAWHPYSDAEQVAHRLVRQRLSSYLSEPYEARRDLDLAALLDEEEERAAAGDDPVVTIRQALLGELLSDLAMTFDALARRDGSTGVRRLDHYVAARRTSDAAGWAWMAVHGLPGDEGEAR